MLESAELITGIIIAAGFSSRMKTFKQLLPLNGLPAVIQAVKSLQAGGLQDIRVVVGYKSEQLIPLLRNLNVKVHINERYAEGMFTSIQVGVADLPQQTKGFFLLPADTPIISRETIRSLIHAFQTQNEIVYPCYLGHRGHPPLVSARYVPDILNWKEEGGLRAFLNGFENYAVDVPVKDQGILLDMDTPWDYLKLCKFCCENPIPSLKECEMLLNIENVPLEVRNHSQAVAFFASELARRLNDAGCSLDLPLIQAAGVLHDIAKGEHNHALKGAERLADYPEVAEIVASHMDICVSPSEFPDEKEIIYLADKLVKKDQLIGLQSRFAFALEKYKDDPLIKQKVMERLENALTIKDKIEALLKMPMDNLELEHLRGK